MVSESDTIEIKTTGLDALIRALKKVPRVRVGVLAGATPRAPDPSGEVVSAPTNATIGFRHEFGTSTLPVRSFLRLPLSTQLQRYLAKSGTLSPTTLKAVVKSGNMVPWLQRVGVVAEAIVADAFDSGGFGTWVPSNMDFKKNHQTLVETQQLRNSITSEVVE